MTYIPVGGRYLVLVLPAVSISVVNSKIILHSEQKESKIGIFVYPWLSFQSNSRDICEDKSGAQSVHSSAHCDLQT